MANVERLYPEISRDKGRVPGVWETNIGKLLMEEQADDIGRGGTHLRQAQHAPVRALRSNRTARSK